MVENKFLKSKGGGPSPNAPPPKYATVYIYIYIYISEAISVLLIDLYSLVKLTEIEIYQPFLILKLTK